MICLDRYEITKDGKVYDKKQNTWLKSYIQDGYVFYRIVDDNGIHLTGAHNLIAQTYCNDWFDGCVVHHKDENKLNNNIDNLQCMTRAEHIRLHKKTILNEPIKVCPVCKEEFVWTTKSQLLHKYNKTRYNDGNPIAGPFCSSKCALRYAVTKRKIRPLKNHVDYETN